MLFTDILIIGGGPAGLCAALQASKYHVRVTILERYHQLGGQLVKQTHRFFGSKDEGAGDRGIHIAQLLQNKVNHNKMIDVRTNAVVLGIYDDHTITFEENGIYEKIIADSMIIATGASEKMLPFEGNDLPGVFGAGAAQTLMNLYGVKPAEKVLMVGAGNIGLIVTYQMLQAGVEVVAIIDAADHIGGYMVHASKVRRLGVPIYMRTTIKEAIGKNYVEKAIIHNLDDHFNSISGTEQELGVDAVCLAVGLTPLTELLRHLECKMKFIHMLGGFVPIHDKYMETTVQNVFVAGDASGVEEASSAMLEGCIAGLSAVISLGYGNNTTVNDRDINIGNLAELRNGDVGLKIRIGIKQLSM